MIELQHSGDRGRRSISQRFTLFFFSFFFFSELGTKPRALRLLGKRSTTELNPQPRLFLTICTDVGLYGCVFKCSACRGQEGETEPVKLEFTGV